MKEVQGYLVISENDPTGRGLLFFDEVSARKHQDTMNELIPKYDDPEDTTWNREQWTKRPKPFEVFELIPRRILTEEEKKPRCSVCGTTKNVRFMGGHQPWLCDSNECIPF